jgi:EAL domain-containing protein (putative c-di-GMP-specific phosphodiesterase class I)
METEATDSSGSESVEEPLGADVFASDERPCVLVVDDEPELVRVIVRVLGAAGIDAIGCNSGTAALDVLRTRPVDAIISDIGMPEMSGTDLVRAVRASDRHVPVIMMTGGPTVESAVSAIEFGVYRYLTKPFAHKVLVETTHRAIQLRRLADAKHAAMRALGETSGLQSDRIGLEAVFNSALESLWPAFQPIVNAREQTLFGYEALLRSNEPALPNPGAVLDAAERLDRLPALFRTMRERSCEVLAAGPRPWLLFLNLHPRDLNDMSLLEPNTLARANAKHIVLEVTERATLDHVVNIRERIASLRDVGYRIAIDDLGAGYAGLNSFAALEPEFVKFDMALIRDIHLSHVKQRLMRVMTDLCHDMGIRVVAEGIETVEERDVVLELGCDLLQGYRFGRPDASLRPPTW